MLTTIAGLVAFVAVSASEPTDSEVLRAMPRVSRGLPYVWEEFRDNITIVKNRIAPSQHPSTAGFATALMQRAKESWECTVYYEHVIQSTYPLPVMVRRAKVQVIYIDKVKAAK